MKQLLFFLCSLLLFSSSCSTADKKAEQPEAEKTDTLKPTTYQLIQKIAEALPMTAKESLDFFADLDSVKMKTTRSAQNQQFQYKTFTVFYVMPAKGLLESVSIDLDTTSHVNMEQLGKELSAKWHSADLIEVEAGKVHYSTDYIDSKRMIKAIHITIGLSHQKENTNEITFMNIDANVE